MNSFDTSFIYYKYNLDVKCVPPGSSQGGAYIVSGLLSARLNIEYSRNIT